MGANRSLEAPLLLLSLPPLHCLPCVCVYTRTIYSGGGRGGDEEDIVVYVGRAKGGWEEWRAGVITSLSGMIEEVQRISERFLSDSLVYVVQ